MKIKVKVKPNSSLQSIKYFEGIYVVNLKSPPEDGKANLELVKILGKYFNKRVIIKSGLKSKNKIVEIE